MQQLVIKLSPQATQDYLSIAQQQQTGNQTADDIQLGINLALVSGLCFAEIDVNGQRINADSEQEDLEMHLISV